MSWLRTWLLAGIREIVIAALNVKAMQAQRQLDEQIDKQNLDPETRLALQKASAQVIEEFRGQLEAELRERI